MINQWPEIIDDIHDLIIEEKLTDGGDMTSEKLLLVLTDESVKKSTSNQWHQWRDQWPMKKWPMKAKVFVIIDDINWPSMLIIVSMTGIID